MRLLTLNCQKGWIDFHRQELEKYLSEELLKAEYDFIFLQEANRRVLKIVEDITDGTDYTLVTSSNPLISGEIMQVAVISRADYRLERLHVLSFATKDKRLLRPEFGIIAGTFRKVGSPIVVAGSFHFHASFHAHLRKQEVVETKEFFINLSRMYPNASIFFGGDANSGLPWEPKMMTSIFAPEFVNLTPFKNPTVCSERLEPSVKLNRLALKLARMGVRIRLKTDYIFTNQDTLKKSTFSSKPVNKIVSDHYPVEVVMYR